MQDKRKACFVINNNSIAYFGPILRHLSPDDFDIVMHGYNSHNPHIKAYGLENFVFKTNLQRALDYEYITGDIHDIPFPDKGQKVVGLFHGMDAQLTKSYLPKISAFIYPYEKAAAHNSKKMTGNQITSASAKDRVEIAYTGPYHCGDSLSLDREYCRKLLKEKYNIEYDPQKPIVFMLESECSDMNQIVDCANKISEYANIIFKPWYILQNQKVVKRISPNVHLIKDTAFNNYILRFSADVILANFYSGSALTTILLGQNLISYNSAMEKLKWPSRRNDPLVPFKEFLKVPEAVLDWKERISDDLSPENKFRAIFYRNDLFIDLDADEKIKDAILGIKYNEKYRQLLPYMQDTLFGKYNAPDAAKLTAELLTDYIHNDTFGSKCSHYIMKK